LFNRRFSAKVCRGVSFLQDDGLRREILRIEAGKESQRKQVVLIVVYLCHLSCVPKKGDPKKGTQRKSFTAGSVVLGTFRKLALRAQTVRNV